MLDHKFVVCLTLIQNLKPVVILKVFHAGVVGIVDSLKSRCQGFPFLVNDVLLHLLLIPRERDPLSHKGAILIMVRY